MPSTYNFVPFDSAVFHHARLNDVRGLQTLFSMKLASPFDCSDFGSTPLMVSIHYVLYEKLES